MYAFALKMFIEDDDYIPGNPFRGINPEAKCMPVLLCCRGGACCPAQNSFQ